VSLPGSEHLTARAQHRLADDWQRPPSVGLIQSILVSLPVIAIGFAMSKMAEGEWWADRDAIADSAKAALATAGISCLKMVLLA
jgi:hypothetical protein